jgi:hypothetical protein
VIAAGLSGAGLVLSPAYAEFEIPGVDGEKGEIEIEYRGAGHWGLPRPDPETGEIDALRQSHEVEIEYSLADWWMVRVTPNFQQKAGDHLEIASLGLETQFVPVTRRGGAFGLALVMGYGPYSQFVDGKPDEFEFGPIAEFSQGRFLLTLNPLLVHEMGRHEDQEWLGFEYAGQLQYRFAKHWSVAAIAFGEIDDLANAGSFSDQTHRLGPGLYWFSEPYEEQGAPRRDDAFDHGHEMEWRVGVGGLMGLTPETADVTLRVTVAAEY